MQTNIYLNFLGNCEEAFKFYETALGGKIGMFQTYADAPAGMPISEDMKKKVLHARIRVGDTQIFGSDAPPDRAGKMGGFSVTLTIDDVAQAEKAFNALSAGGQAHMPLSESFFAKRWGMAVDKFGVPWMVLCQPVLD